MHSQTHVLNDGSRLLIRNANPEDAAAIVEFAESTAAETDFLSFGAGEFGRTAEQEAVFVEESLATDNQLYLVGFVDGVLVGTLRFIGGRRVRVRHCGEFGMSIRRAYWSRGIGSRFLDGLIGWACAGGIVTKIMLRTRTDNDRALQLYRRKGFVREGTLHKDFCVNGRYFDHALMSLEIVPTSPVVSP